MFLNGIDNLPAYIVPPILGFFVFVCLALLSLVRGRKSYANILFAGFCLSGALINLDIALVSMIDDEATALRIDRFIYLFFVFSIPIYIRFVHVFLGSSRRWIEGTAYFLSLVFLFFSQTDLFISGYHAYPFGRIARAGPVYHLFCAVGGVTSLYCVAMLSIALRRAKESRQKNRIKYILLGMGLSAFLLFLNYLPISGYNVYPMGNFGFIPAIILAFGVLKYDLVDMNAMIRKGMVYFFLTGFLTVLYVFLLYGFNLLLMEPWDEPDIVNPLLLALFMVFLFDPIKSEVQRFVDRHFFRGKYDYQRMLKEISGRMTSLLRFDEIRDVLLRSIHDILQVERAGLVVFKGDEGVFHFYPSRAERTRDVPETLAADHPLLSCFKERKDPLSRTLIPMQSLSREDLEQVSRVFDRCRAVIMIPVISRNVVKGIIVLGEKKSGELFVQEDLELLSTIANQCAIAFENAAIYEEVERLNRDLERKVVERTADLHQALEEKQRTQKQLIQSESLAAIGQLVAGVAHELNSPLASASSLVQTSIESLRQERSRANERNDGEEILADLEFTMKELGRVRDIVRSLLDLSRQTQTYVEPVNMNAVVEDALTVLRNQYKNLDVSIRTDFEQDLPKIKGNFANLGQVFINIIRNAIQALPEGRGSVTLRTRYRQRPERVIIECFDTGRGIPSGILQNVFNPFFTTKETGRGTGLGLYISHEIVKRHGGTIEVMSEENKGSVFRVELPLIHT